MTVYMNEVVYRTQTSARVAVSSNLASRHPPASPCTCCGFFGSVGASARLGHAARMRWDQWLWNIRLYRSRSLAQAAIKDGRVVVDGVAIKPAREAKAGETVSARTGDLTRVYKVLGFPPRRISAPEVAAFAEDLTPAQAREEAHQKTLEPGFRPRGAGRPTKRDRRQIERWSDLG